MKAANIAGNRGPAAGVCMSRSDGQLGAGPVRELRLVRSAKPGASAEAAAATATRQILLQQAPGQKALIDRAYAETKAVPDGAAKTDGVAIGENPPPRCLRTGPDGTNVPDTYRPMTTPGAFGFRPRRPCSPNMR